MPPQALWTDSFDARGLGLVTPSTRPTNLSTSGSISTFQRRDVPISQSTYNPSTDGYSGVLISSSSTPDRPRKRLTPEQTKMLESSFQENPKPTTERRDEISKQLDILPRTVQIWFQNRRARARSQNEEKIVNRLTTQNTLAKAMTPVISKSSSPAPSSQFQIHQPGPQLQQVQHQHQQPLQQMPHSHSAQQPLLTPKLAPNGLPVAPVQQNGPPKKNLAVAAAATALTAKNQEQGQLYQQLMMKRHEQQKILTAQRMPQISVQTQTTMFPGNGSGNNFKLESANNSPTSLSSGSYAQFGSTQTLAAGELSQGGVQSQLYFGTSNGNANDNSEQDFSASQIPVSYYTSFPQSQQAPSGPGTQMGSNGASLPQTNLDQHSAVLLQNQNFSQSSQPPPPAPPLPQQQQQQSQTPLMSHVFSPQNQQPPSGGMFMHVSPPPNGQRPNQAAAAATAALYPQASPAQSQRQMAGIHRQFSQRTPIPYPFLEIDPKKQTSSFSPRSPTITSSTNSDVHLDEYMLTPLSSLQSPDSSPFISQLLSYRQPHGNSATANHASNHSNSRRASTHQQSSLSQVYPTNSFVFSDGSQVPSTPLSGALTSEASVSVRGSLTGSFSADAWHASPANSPPKSDYNAKLSFSDTPLTSHEDVQALYSALEGENAELFSSMPRSGGLDVSPLENAEYELQTGMSSDIPSDIAADIPSVMVSKNDDEAMNTDANDSTEDGSVDSQMMNGSSHVPVDEDQKMDQNFDNLSAFSAHNTQNETMMANDLFREFDMSQYSELDDMVTSLN